ncbi:diguanylate cyclase [Halomicronema sp. CCY15110]|uniref:GGDEF domain-containing protein n=1 Tax=Halomicronema sp. CCY15110 TaxID=2767773 RepID=UPI00194E473E|nr:diguanylate cyclase [Halomicronema sp. CCY15110]
MSKPNDRMAALEQERNDLIAENQQLRQALAGLQKAHKRVRSQLSRERLIDEIAQQIRQSLKFDDILSTAVAEVRQFLDVDRALIYRFQPDWSGIITFESTAPEISSILYTKFEEPCFRHSYVERYQAGRVRAIADIDAADVQACHRQLLATYQVRANLVVPILQGDDTLWGLLIAHHCRATRQWDEFDIGLLQRLATQLGVAIQQSELHAQLAERATTDALTQLANRRRFDQYLGEVWQQHHRRQSAIALLMLDIDFFKRYNDHYGHPQGDECLRQVSQALSQAVKRTIDLVARYGGEEFAVVLPDTEIAGALEVAAAIQAGVAQLNIEHRESPFGLITLSCGVAADLPQNQDSPDYLIKAADQALYQAKTSGRNRVVCANPR